MENKELQCPFCKGFHIGVNSKKTGRMICLDCRKSFMPGGPIYKRKGESNTIEGTKSSIPISAQKYIKRICLNDNITANGKLELIQDNLNVDPETVLQWLNILGVSFESSQLSIAKLHTIPNSKIYFISSAQTASVAHVELLKNMKTLAKFYGAEIGIIATRYQNPTSTWMDKGNTWDDAVLPYLTARRQELHPRVVMLGDVKIQATAPNPTNGIELMGNGKSCIVGAPRIEFRSLSTLINQDQVFLHSTGTVTAPSFTESVAGAKAKHHHSYGFLIVEVDGDEVHLRNVSAHRDGSFTDLIWRVKDGNIEKVTIPTLVWGDSHFAQKEERVTRAFRRFTRDLGVTRSVLHDVWDSKSLNVHNLNNPIKSHELLMDDDDCLNSELNQMYDELDWFEDNMDETIVVASNHDDMLDRAMIHGDWRDNLKNAVTFVDMLKLTLSHKAVNGIIPYYINNRYNKIRALGLNDSFFINGIEVALHGHKGPNGSRGSINSFAKLPFKTVIAHGHCPGIRWGCYQVGVSCGLQHGYNDGLSGWAYDGVTIDDTGKRQSIVFNAKTMRYTTLI